MNELLSVFLSIFIYIVFVLLPMFPAIKIYQLFPTDKIGVKGPLGHLTINASGAFAAYVIISIMGYFIIQKALDLITAGMSKESSWLVSAEIELQDAQGKPLEISETLRNTLNVTIQPDFRTISQKYVNLKLPELDNKTIITYAMQGFIPVDRKPEKTDAATFEKDLTAHRIYLGKIVLKQEAQKYNQPDTLKRSKDKLDLW